MKKLILFLLLNILGGLMAWATHNRAGQITIKHIDDLTIEATITTYTNTFGSDVADRDSLYISWGDNSMTTLARINGPDVDPSNGVPDGEIITDGYRRNEYVGIHTYSGYGDYTVYLSDPNRNEGIVNLDGLSLKNMCEINLIKSFLKCRI